MSLKFSNLQRGATRYLSKLIAIIYFISCPLAEFAGAEAVERVFTHFSAMLPSGWDGEEQKAFVSGNPEEYLLVLGRKDAEGENFLAQISIFLLPNKPGADPLEAAKTLAEAQGGASDPAREGALWTFTGEPRTNVVKGRAKTLVNANAEKLLVIIAQDPDNLGAEEILDSLSGQSGEARELLGR